MKNKEEIKSFFNVDEIGYQKLYTMHENGMETFNLSLFYFLLQNKGNEEIIGECGFHSWNLTHHRAELFYLLKKDDDKQKGFL